MKMKWSGGSAGFDNDVNELAARIPRFSIIELRILDLIADGLLNKQIAFECRRSEHTVKAHAAKIFKQLDHLPRTRIAVLYAVLRDRERALRASEASSSQTRCCSGPGCAQKVRT